MKIETVYSDGDRVYSIVRSRGPRTIRSKCSGCDGVGDIILKNGEKFTCPKCVGWKVILKYGPFKWKPYKRVIVIDKVIVRKEIGNILDIMYVELNTGTEFRAGDLFETRKEAETACGERNKLFAQKL